MNTPNNKTLSLFFLITKISVYSVMSDMLLICIIDFRIYGFLVTPLKSNTPSLKDVFNTVYSVMSDILA